jgi:hypothetical protein
MRAMIKRFKNMIRVMKSRRMRLAEHVEGTNITRKECKIIVTKRLRYHFKDLEENMG